MKINFLGLFLFSLACLVACDDNTSTLGSEVMPEGDRIVVSTASYDVSTQSILAERLVAKTTTAYLGKYTDPYSETIFETDFLAQFNCLENFEFPEIEAMKKEEDGNIYAKLAELRLYFTSFYGDSLNTQTLKVYPLNRRLEEDEVYYTDIDPTEYYDVNADPIATKTYSVIDKSVKDSTRWSSSYYPNVRILSDQLTDYGTELINKYYEDPKNFANASAFIENVCKGFYFKCTQGDGTVLYVDQAHLNIYFDYYIDSSTGTLDSLVTGVAQFAATPEVIQANRFSTKNLDRLVSDNTCTYLQTPAGIFTEATLPIDELSMNDSITSAQVIFTRYNNFNEETYQMGTPSTLLMLPKSELQTFFAENKVPDSQTYYTATYNSSYNQYDFSNISYYVNQLRIKKRLHPDDYNKDPDWNKVVLVPVVLTEQTINSSSVVVAARHDLQMNYAKLKGNKDKLEMKVIYSKFKNN